MFTPCPPNININLPRIKDAKHLRTTPMMRQAAQNKPTRRRHIAMIITIMMMVMMMIAHAH